MLTQKHLKDLLHYNPDTGVFVWLVNRGRLAKKGDTAGCDNGDGYRRILIDGKKYYSSRLAYLYMLGFIPREIDHIDRNRSNNRWSNLTKTNRSKNMLNAGLYPSNTTGFKGVSPHKDGGFVASITINKKRHYLGKFKTIDEAHNKRQDFAKNYAVLGS